MKHLFIDDEMVEESTACELTVNQPEKLGPITEVNKVNIYNRSAYGTVLDNGHIARMWGGSGSGPGGVRPKPGLQYSTSLDGLTWYSPDLEGYKAGKKRKSNVVVEANAEGSIFIDPNDRAFPYKYVFHENDVGLQMIKSPDGIDWIKPSLLLDSGHRDTQNTFFFDRRIEKYVGYMRGWTQPRSVQDREKTRLRCIERVEFEDFSQLIPSKKQGGRALGESAIVMKPDDEDMPDVDLYNNAVIQYRDDVYLAFPSLYRHLQIGKGYDYRELPNEGIMEAQLAVSRDGIKWNRFRRPYFQPGAYGEGDNCVVYMMCGTVQREGYVYQYYAGSDYTHRLNNIFSVRGIHYYLVYALRQRIDGFVSYSNYDTVPGHLQTKSVPWHGYLFANYDAGASGYIKARVLGLDDKVLATQKVPLVGNWPAKQIEFDNDLLKYINKPVKISFEFRNCKIFGFEV